MSLGMFVALVALACTQPAFSQSTREPGPQITGYDWQERWVTTLNTCTKNPLGQYETLINISNDGSTPFKIQSLSITGPDAAYFKFDNSDPATSITPLPGLEIRPGEANKRTQKVLFTPDAERSYYALMCLTTDSGTSVCNIIQGVGIESHIGLAGKDFGNVAFQGAESTRVSGNVELIIEPTRPTTITEIFISGPDAAEFRLDWARATAPYNYQPTPAAPWINIPLGTHIDIPVDFVPSIPGGKSAQLDVVGDFSECDISRVPLSGNAVTSLSVSSFAVDQLLLTTDRTGAFTFSLPHAAAITLDLHDASGNRVARLADGVMEGGVHRIASENRELASGVYLYRLTIDGTVRTGRVVVVR
jgi:hypothetical protein